MHFVISELAKRSDLISTAVGYLESHMNPKLFKQIPYTDKELPDFHVLPPILFGLPTNLKHNWKQFFTTIGINTLFQGVECCKHCGNCNLMPENTTTLWVGIAFLDNLMNRRISTIQPTIGPRLLPNINLEETVVYNAPVLVFENGIVLRGAERFVLRCYLEEPLTRHKHGVLGMSQNVIMLGKAFQNL